MENHNFTTSSVPLLDETYAYGVVEHPFPLNCCLGNWKLGSEFYQAVKIGIVQYVCTTFYLPEQVMLSLCEKIVTYVLMVADDIEDDMCITGNIF